MKDYLSGFELYLTDVKKVSNNTFDSYVRDISQFITYCSVVNCIDTARADSDFISGFLSYLEKHGKSSSTMSRVLASLRCYYGYLASQNMIECSPISQLKNFTCEKKLPEILTNREIELLLSQPTGTDYKSMRDKAILEMLYATGLKVSELIMLNLKDVNLQIGIIHMRMPKGERIIPMYPAAIKCLSDYIKFARKAVIGNNDVDILFTNMNGQPLTRQGLWKIIKGYSVSANIKKDITPHMLRHSFAAHLLENGAELCDIKEMLGHSDISSTQIYAKMMRNKYTRAYKQFHPMAK